MAVRREDIPRIEQLTEMLMRSAQYGYTTEEIRSIREELKSLRPQDEEDESDGD